MVGPILFFSKTALLLLFYRMFSQDRMFRYKLYGPCVFIAATTLSNVPLILDNGSWEMGQINCQKTTLYSIIQGSMNVVFDLFSIYLPASVIVHLNLPFQRKVGMLGIFATGIL